MRRIAAELAVLGHPVSAATVQRYRGDRPPSPSWRTFLRLHASEIWAADFFTVQTLPFRTCYVFVLISHDRRRLVHWNVTRHPTQAWVWQQIREATPWGVQPRFLLRDRDRCYGGDFLRRAAAMGITTVLSPVRAPQANAIAERVIGTLRRDCLDHVLVLSERHLRHVLQEYVAYDNTTRPHQSLGDEPPDGPRHAHRPPGPMRLTSRPILGGLHHEYAWQAAGRSFETPQPNPARARTPEPREPAFHIHRATTPCGSRQDRWQDRGCGSQHRSFRGHGSRLKGASVLCRQSGVARAKLNRVPVVHGAHRRLDTAVAQHPALLFLRGNL